MYMFKYYIYIIVQIIHKTAFIIRIFTRYILVNSDVDNNVISRLSIVVK